MKKFSVLAFCIVTFVIASAARSQTAGADSWKNVTLGPFFMPGASANAGSVANGAKTDVADFSWSLGAVADFPFSPSFGLQFAACYDSRAVGFYNQANSSNSIDYTFSYFSLRPEFKLGDFLVGLGIGIPVGASATAGTGETAPTSLGASNMNLLFEIRIGAAIPVITADNGNMLNFMVDGSYAFSQITSAALPPYTGTADKSDNNGPFGTLQLGFAYMFNLNPH